MQSIFFLMPGQEYPGCITYLSDDKTHNLIKEVYTKCSVKLNKTSLSTQYDYFHEYCLTFVPHEKESFRLSLEHSIEISDTYSGNINAIMDPYEFFFYLFHEELNISQLKVGKFSQNNSIIKLICTNIMNKNITDLKIDKSSIDDDGLEQLVLQRVNNSSLKILNIINSSLGTRDEKSHNKIKKLHEELEHQKRVISTTEHKSKLSTEKQDFLSRNFLKGSFQLSASDAKYNIEKYKKKYGTTIVFNGETKVGKEYINKEKREILEEHANILDKKNHYAHYVITWWLEEELSCGKRFEISNFRNSNFFDSYFDIKSKISHFLDSEGAINEFLDEDQQNELNEIISKHFKVIFDKNIKLFTEYLQYEINNINVSIDIVSEEIKEIQNDLKNEDIVGYFFTNGKSIDNNHFEVLIITKNEVIKPIEWPVSVGVIKNEHIVNNTLYSVGVGNIFKEINSGKNTKNICPQADNVSCAALGLAYLKELLKNEAEQYKNFTKTISFYNEDDKLVHFFIVSPQVLRYSQSKFFNDIISALFNDENTEVEHHDKTVTVLCLEHILKHSIKKAEELNDTKTLEKNTKLLKELPEFKKQWIEQYKESCIHRELMNDEKLRENRYLCYKSFNMHLFSLSPKPDINSGDVSVAKLGY
jgi:hypothetical protein